METMVKPRGLPDNISPEARDNTPDISLLPGFLEEATARWRQKGLTIARDSDEVTSDFLSSDRFILEALPGSGKTTVAPVEFLRVLLKKDPQARVLVTEPTILAVESLEEYIGSETHNAFVDSHHRKKPFSKPEARLQFIVEQSLRNELVRNPVLMGVNCVVLDEVHTSDPILLALLKEAQLKRKSEGIEQLKLVLTSGTVDVEPLRNFLGDNTAEVKTLKVEGDKKTIHEHFLETPINSDQAPVAAAKRAKAILDDPKIDGDILIFMPGRREINKTKEALSSLLDGVDIEVISIMGGDQDGNPYKKINSKSANKRRIIVSTNIAEMSITIPNVNVIDSGLMKDMVYDPKTRVSTLVTRPHTQENYTQRKGRAGRTGQGHFFALYTQAELSQRPMHPVHEFVQTDKITDVLWLRANNRDIYTFNYKDKPNKEVLDQAVQALQKLGALDSEGNITVIGREMAEISEEPKYARMIVEARKRNCTNAVALLIGALKTNESIFELTGNETVATKYKDLVDHNSDFITFLNAWNKAQATNGEGFNKKAIERIKRARGSLKQGSSSIDVTGIDLTSPEMIEAINLSIASGIMDKKIVFENGAYKYDQAIYSGIRIDRTSGFYQKIEPELLSGEVNSNKKPNSRVSSQSKWNMAFDPGKLVQEFNYLAEFINIDKPDFTEIETPKAIEKVDQPDLEVVPDINENIVQNLSIQVEKAPTEEVKKEAVNLIGKVRENWHKLTDKVKEIYIRFKNTVKSVFRI